MKKLPSFRRRGAALIVVLSIIVLVSGLVVGLAMAMRMERSASYYHLERMRADLMARQGVDYAQAVISAATENRYWVSGPGRIYATAPGTTAAPLSLIELSSGVTSSTNSTNSTEINRSGWSDQSRLLDPAGTNLNVRWIYVKKSATPGGGSYDTNSSPTIDTNVVGRFAFWVDDESSRVDLSTANQRTVESKDWASPQQIDLPSLSGFSNSTVLTTVRQRAGQGTLNTPNEIFAVADANLSSALITNRFYLTHYTQSPELDPWGVGKTVLTTRPDLASFRNNFINILAGTNNNAGLLSELGTVQVNSNLSMIMNRLLQTNWPFVSNTNASWASKYGTNGAAQLALDIVEYVRSTESQEAFVEPLTATLTGTNLIYSPTMSAANFGPNVLIGTTRRPMISEMAVAVDDAAGTNGAFSGRLFVEVFVPSGYGLGATNVPSQLFIASSLTANVPAPATAMATNSTTNGAFLRFEQIFTTNARPTTVPLRIALFKGSADTAANILDVAPMNSTAFINYTVLTNGGATNLISSYEVRDPRVNKYVINWEPAGTNSMFPPATNSRWSALIAPPVGQLSADTDSNGVMSEASLQMANTGIVGSVGELGYINTGVASNMPWRSVRLQPSGATNTNNVPDWALLELFTAPVASAANVPSLNTVAGQVNLNALILSSVGTNMSRTNVLNTLLPSPIVLTGTSLTNAAIISNVINPTNLAANGANFGNITNTRIYQSVGQLAEMRGISDTGEASEKVMRQVASLATVKGDVFSVYSVGQAVQVTKSGKMVVNGEKMVRAIVERTFNSANEPQYKVIYWSEIYP